MQSALVITDGLEQFVLTPETEAEKMLVKMLTSTGLRDMTIHRGSFYECKGGWYRQGPSDDSAIICLRPKNPETHPKEFVNIDKELSEMGL